MHQPALCFADFFSGHARMAITAKPILIDAPRSLQQARSQTH